jgi:hypothetical protein
MTVPNLQELFGSRFRIGHDPAAVTYAERADPWMQTIRCRRGVVIYPQEEGMLAVEIDVHPGLAKQVEAIEGVKVYQAGGQWPGSREECTYHFPLSAFDAVAAIVKPMRRPKLTPEQRAEKSANMAKVRESKGVAVSK